MPLWNLKNVQQRAREKAEKAGHKVKRVRSLVTGLWIEVETYNAGIIRYSDYELI